MSTSKVQVFDTTLRDGGQREGITYSVADKLAIARLLDEFGVAYIEGGWPGAMPKDTEFFARARTELDLKHATLVAFGQTASAVVVEKRRGLGIDAVAIVAQVAQRRLRPAVRRCARQPEHRRNCRSRHQRDPVRERNPHCAPG